MDRKTSVRSIALCLFLVLLSITLMGSSGDDCIRCEDDGCEYQPGFAKEFREAMERNNEREFEEYKGPEYLDVYSYKDGKRSVNWENVYINRQRRETVRKQEYERWCKSPEGRAYIKKLEAYSKKAKEKSDAFYDFNNRNFWNRNR